MTAAYRRLAPVPAFLIALTLPGTVSGQVIPPPNALKARVDHIVLGHVHANDWYKWLAVGVIIEGQSGVFYYSRNANADGTPNANTLFRIGSVTKTMTGALLALQDGHGLRLPACDSAPPQQQAPPSLLATMLATHCPSCGPLPPPRDAITIEQLATHRSGLPKWPSVPACNEDQVFQSVTRVCMNFTTPPSGCIAGRPPDDTPGNGIDDVCNLPPASNLCATSPDQIPCASPGPGANNYSNWGYYVLGHLLARNAGAASWQALLREKLLTPYGMTHSLVDGEPLGSLIKAPEWMNCTASYLPSGPVLTNCDTKPASSPSVLSAPGGGLWSTGPDMLKYLKFAMGLPPATPSPEADALLAARPSIFCTREGTDQAGTGLGWYRRLLNGETSWSKNGGLGSFEAYMLLLPSRNSGVFILSNTQSLEAEEGGDGTKRLAQAILSTP